MRHGRCAGAREAGGDAYGNAKDRLARGLGGGPRLQQLRRPARRRATARSWTRRSTPASTSSTPPTSTADARARSTSAGRSAAGATRSVLATKFGMKVDEQRQGAAPAYVRQARRGQPAPARHRPHRPVPAAPARPATPIADTLGALDELVRAGKVREIGCSNFSAAQLREAASGGAAPARARFVSVQNEYSLLHREPEAGVLAECERAGPRLPPLLPAGERAADRQVPAGPGRRPQGARLRRRPLRRRCSRRATSPRSRR